MQLTGKQIIELGIVTNYVPEAIQQQGIDVRVDKLKELFNGGMIPTHGKTALPISKEIAPSIIDGHEIFELEPGYYEVELVEGIHMTDDTALVYKTRSSLVRCGSIVESGQFDAGFNTDKAGCFLIVHLPIAIERGARIAQTIVNKTDKVINTYDGQFQNDKQRDTK